MKPILNPHPISVTLTAQTPDDAYEIAHRYIYDILHEDPEGAPWHLINWRSKLRGAVELYLLFPLTTRRRKFLKEITNARMQFVIFENPDGV